MKQICNEIERGNNLEVNLPKLFNRLSTLYEQYAEVKFTLYYYNFYESFLDFEEKNNTDEEKQLIMALNKVIKDSYLSGFSGDKMESSVKTLDSLRNQVIKKMQILTSFTDIFQNYEYILNRIENRFHEDLSDIDDEEFTVQIMNYIFEIKDNVIINDRIKEVIGELPIRITKSKYFDLIRESLSIYIGGDISSVDTYLYMLKNSAMLYSPEGMDTVYPELLSLRKRLESCDYKNINEEEYHSLTSSIEQAADNIHAAVDFYYAIQEVINHLYAIILMTPYSFMESSNISDKDLYKPIVHEIYDQFQEDKKVPLLEKTEDKLIYTEGKQENLFAEIGILETVLPVIKTSHAGLVDSLMLGSHFRSLEVAQNLLGSSLFIELKQMTEDKKADSTYIAKVQDELITQLTDVFLKHSKNMYRAVVANTISKMPIFFQSVDDIRDYVKNSLEQCRDIAEKSACVDIIKNLLKN